MSAAEMKTYDEYLRLLSRKDHGKSVYLAESEVRASAVFKSESNGRAVLHTLRALGRLRLVRVGSENTYLLL